MKLKFERALCSGRSQQSGHIFEPIRGTRLYMYVHVQLWMAGLSNETRPQWRSHWYDTNRATNRTIPNTTQFHTTNYIIGWKWLSNIRLARDTRLFIRLIYNHFHKRLHMDRLVIQTFRKRVSNHALFRCIYLCKRCHPGSHYYSTKQRRFCSHSPNSYVSPKRLCFSILESLFDECLFQTIRVLQ